MKKNVSEKRTQVYFPEDLYRSLEKQARAEDKSASQVIREAVEMYLHEKHEDIDWDNDPLYKAVGIFNSATGDLAENHDTYLYGMKKTTRP
jgi:metal-responsive CopG/Arc/MetJ family transcriptional regulator